MPSVGRALRAGRIVRILQQLEDVPAAVLTLDEFFRGAALVERLEQLGLVTAQDRVLDEAKFVVKDLCGGIHG